MKGMVIRYFNSEGKEIEQIVLDEYSVDDHLWELMQQAEYLAGRKGIAYDHYRIAYEELWYDSKTNKVY